MTLFRRDILIRSACIALLIVAVYHSTLANRFVWDDLDIIVKNPLLESFRNLPKLFLYEDRTGDGPTGYYRPMTYISFMVDRSLWGLNPVGFNITNLFLHAAVTLLFYRVVAALFGRERLALTAALLFALHPVAGETVNFHAGGRNTLLAAAFALLALRFRLDRRDAAALACFTAAIFSKEFALLLPAVFFWHDRYLRGERPSWPGYAPYAAAIAGYLTLRSFAVAQGNLLKTVMLSDNLLLIPTIIVNYLKNMLFPLQLKVIYDIPAGVTPWTALHALLLAAVIALALRFRKNGELAFSSAWFFLFLLPVIGIVPLGSALIADRYAYFSLMGFCLALAHLLCRGDRKAATAVTAIICTVFAAIGIVRNPYWKNMPSLYARMTVDAPGKSIGFTNLGMYYYENGDLANAEKYLEQSTSKKGIVIRDAYQYLSAVYWEGNKLDKALALLEKMIAMEPGNPQPYIMASRIYESMGEKEKARSYHARVTALFPQIEEMMEGRVRTLCREGEKLMAEGRATEAERKFREALMMKPGFVPALIDMGSLAAEKGDLAGALAHFARAAAIDPGNPSVHYNLSMIYEMTGRTAEAAAEMKKFRELEASSPRGGAAPGAGQ